MENLTPLDIIEVFERVLKTAKKYSGPGSKQKILWELLTGLRGPDPNEFCINITLKKLTTARIRGFLGLHNSLFLTRRTPLTDAELKERDALLEKSPAHFRAHYHMAVDSIQAFFGYSLYSEKTLEFKK